MPEDSLERFLEIASRYVDLKQPLTLLELGARDGAETAEFSRLLPGARIFSFECNPQTLPLCRERCEALANVTLIEKAVSSADGVVAFFPIDPERTTTTWEDGNPGASSLFRASGKYPVETYVQNEIEVESIRLDTFLEEQGVTDVALLWMDIQGSELMALKSASEHLGDVGLIHLEVGFLDIYDGQPLFPQIKRFLLRKGFLFVGFTNLGIYAGDVVFVNRKLVESRTRYKLVARTLLASGSQNGLRAVLRRGRAAIRLLLVRGVVRRYKDSSRFYSMSRMERLQHVLAIARLSAKRRFGLDPNFRASIHSEEKLDVVVPLIERDLEVFEVTLAGLRKNLRHPVGSIYVVSPLSAKVQEFCQIHGCTWVDDEVLLADMPTFTYVVDGVDRVGWMRQQFIKLSANRVTQAQNILILDSDTVLVRPQVYFHRGKVIFNNSDEHHEPYFTVYRDLLHEEPSARLSLVSHSMIFQRDMLDELHAAIERIHGRPWMEAVLSVLDFSDASAFCEYELYGNYYLKRKSATALYWYNTAPRAERSKDIDDLSARYGKKYKTASFHWYSRAE